MWFRKSVPQPPPTEDSEKFVKWLLEYGDDLAPLRLLYKNNIDGFVNINWKSVKKEIDDHHLFSGDSLLDRAGAIAQFYEIEYKGLVSERGGLHRCSPDLQAHAVMLLVKVSVMLYLAKHKYHADVPEDLLKMDKL